MSMNAVGPKRRSRLSLVLALVLPLGLIACGDETLYSGLTERQVNTMVALLHKGGVPASKSRGSDGAYAIGTPAKHFGVAVEMLQANGLPADHYDSLGDVFAKEGLVSSPLEERARLNHALSQEIARTISSIDGVVLARVHLAVPEHDALVDTIRPASASVFVKHRGDVDLSGSISRIKALVVDGIENLPYDNVTVALFEARDAGLPVSPGAAYADDAPSTAIASVVPGDGFGSRGLVFALLGVALLVGVVTWLHGRRRRVAPGSGT